MRLHTKLQRIRTAIIAFFALAGITILSLPLQASAATAAGSTQAGAKKMSQMLRHPYSPRYVALGDSVAAGLGLASVPNASVEDAACGRSSLAYSKKVAQRINDELSDFDIQLNEANVSCQGATTDNFLQAQTVGQVTAQPQLDKAFAQGRPDLVTITMGSNDVRWAQFLGICFSAANCDTAGNTAAAAAYIAEMKTKMTSALDEIKARSGFIPPLVVVTGYYNPVSAQCVNPNLSTEEVTWISDEARALNKALEEATRQRGTGWFTQFAPVDFTGHDICSSDSWIQRPGVPGEPAPFHPTARGQQAMADAVLASIGLDY